MKPFRSLLFVPGQKQDWVDKAIAAGPDALILDLEDAVPTDGKAQARETVAASITRVRAAGSEVGLVVRGVLIAVALRAVSHCFRPVATALASHTAPRGRADHTDGARASQPKRMRHKSLKTRPKMRSLGIGRPPHAAMRRETGSDRSVGAKAMLR